MKLCDYTMAPNPRHVRVFLAEKGIEIEKEQVDIPASENLAPAFRAINPHGLLPALTLDDGTVIDESVAICLCFESLQPAPPHWSEWTPSRAPVIASVQRHMEFDDLPAVPVLVVRGQAATERF